MVRPSLFLRPPRSSFKDLCFFFTSLRFFRPVRWGLALFVLNWNLRFPHASLSFKNGSKFPASATFRLLFWLISSKCSRRVIAPLFSDLWMTMSRDTLLVGILSFLRNGPYGCTYPNLFCWLIFKSATCFNCLNSLLYKFKPFLKELTNTETRHTDHFK